MIVCFDLETTGLDKYNDKIIEVALLKFDEKTFKIIERFSSLVNPEILIPDIISNITNIFQEDVNDAPKFEDIKKEIKDFIWDSVLLWHNVDFDISFLQANGIDLIDNIKIDTFFIANFLSYNNPSLNLEMLCNSYDIKFEWAHRALNDAEATIYLFQNQLKNFSKLNESKKNIISYVFSLSNDKNIKYLEDLFFPLFSWRINYWDFERIILKKIWKKPYSSNSIDDINDLWEINFERILSFDWILEERKNQLSMTKEVYNTLNEKQKIVIEAPTWLWKSFAYLIPSIVFSLKNNKKIYISTKTKTLQDQLFYNDLKFLKENLSFDFSYSKLKWKKNYISLKAFFDYINLWQFEYKEISFLTKISLWLLETEYWELDDLNYYWEEFLLLKDLNSDINISKEKNPYYSYEFYTKAREALNNTNITIINHSLLFISLQEWNTDLPKLDNLIIDEAHNIEDSLTESLKESYNFIQFNDYLERCHKVLKIKKIDSLDFLKVKEELIANLMVLDDYVIEYINEKSSENNQYKTVLIRDDFFVKLNCEDFVKKIKLNLLDLIDILRTKDDYDFIKELDFFEFIAKTLSDFFDNSNKNKYIKYLTHNEKFWISYTYTLLNVWWFLDENLWEKLDSCVLTSATLRIWDNFNYISSILGLTNFNFSSFDSDFDYRKQATLFIPVDIWSIKSNIEEVIDFLRKFYLLVRWNTLTLLTNFATIKSIYTGINNDLKKEGINLYAQSIGWSKMKLLSFFKKSPNNSILLWTDSFWEWVNIPWEDLKYLIIHKFPFQVPTDPIFQARSILFKDSFLEYSIPKSILKLKQWFWRLIRSKEDKWIVILLDNRINSEWWNKFYEAFPKDINIKKASKSQLLDLLELKR